LRLNQTIKFSKKCSYKSYIFVLIFFIFNANILFSNNHFVENQSQISGSSFPETDGHLAINPTNQNNLGFFSIQHRNTQNRDNFLAPIHYSTNRGASWRLSNFVFIPNLDYTFLADVSSPVVAFSSEGICVASIIYTLFNKISEDKTEVTQIIIWAKSTNGGRTWAYAEDNVLNSNKTFLDYSKPNFGLGRVFSCLDIESTSDNKVIISTIENSNGEERNSKIRLYKIDLNDDKTAELPSKIIGQEKVVISDIHTYFSEDILHFIFVEQDGIYTNYYLNYSFANNKFGEEIKISDYYFKNTEPDEDFFPSKFNPHPSITSSSGNQKIYCTWNASGINQASNIQKIYLSTSDNFGTTWSEPKIISQAGSSDCFYSNISKNGDSLIISFLERQKKDSSNANTILMIKDESKKSEEKNIQKYIINNYSRELSWSKVDNFPYQFGRSNRCEIGDNFYGVIWPFVSSEDGNIDYKFNLFPLGNNFEEDDDNDIEVYISNQSSDLVENINIRIKVLEKTNLALKLYDINAKLELVLYDDKIQMGEYYFVIPKKDFSSGMKILYCRGKKTLISKKLIIR
jgi:hypothetical protein